MIHNETYNMVIHIYTVAMHTVTHPSEFVFKFIFKEKITNTLCLFIFKFRFKVAV